MAYVITVFDRPDREHLREANQLSHYEYLERHQHLILLRGGFPNGDQGGFRGGMLVLDVPTLEAAKDFIANDPYATAGMQGEVRIEPFKPAYCAPAQRWR